MVAEHRVPLPAPLASKLSTPRRPAGCRENVSKPEVSCAVSDARLQVQKFDQMLISLRFGRKARVLALYLLRYQTALTTPVGPV
jgi:hypothetical protein